MAMPMERHTYMVIRDIGIITISVLVAINLVQSGVIGNIIGSSEELTFLGSFIAGLFFTSVFTTAPATAALATLTQSHPLLSVAFTGAIGALIGDVIIFRFVKDSLSDDIAYLLRKAKQKRLMAIFHLKVFRWLGPFLGAIIVASPLPDEIGVAMMGIGKLPMWRFIPISFSANFIGILAIGLIARSF